MVGMVKGPISLLQMRLGRIPAWLAAMNNADLCPFEEARSSRFRNVPKTALLAWALLLAPIGSAQAQWVAFNDHYQGKGSSNNATFWNVYTNRNGAPGTAGALKSITNGTALPVTLTITNQNLPPGVTQTASPTTGSPAYNVFNKWIDWGLGSNYWNSIVLNTNSLVAHIFTGLRTDRLYSLKATAMRGAGLTTSWVLGRLDGAIQFRAAHSANVQTTLQVPALATNEAILNSGANNSTGDLFDWEDILPANGTLVLYSSKYSGTVLNGSSSHSNAFAPVAIRLEERPATALAITSQPRDASVCTGTPVSFSVGVSGTPPYRYQWLKVILGVSTNNIPSETNAIYTIASTSAGDQASYQVIVTNSLSSVTSRLAALTVLSTPVVITNEPDDALVIIGAPATFSLDWTNNAARPAFVFWYGNSESNDLTGSLLSVVSNGVSYSASYILSAAYPTNLPYYYAVVSNCISMDASRVALLNVYYGAVTITNEPVNQAVLLGGSATFVVGASGSWPQYQWYKGSTALADQTNASLVLSNLQISDSGSYHCLVSNLTSSATSTDATLIVNGKPYDLVQLKTASAGGSSNAIWRYNQDGADLGTAWRAPDYDDSGWPSGRGGLMREDNQTVTAWRQTTLSLTSTNGGTNWTYYFRACFNLTNDPTDTLVFTTNLFDDGMVVYLNGTEAYRYNMPAGPIGYSTPAGNLPAEGQLYITNLPSSLLVQGTNCLAVEVHQVDIYSSDIVMGLGAMAVPPTTTPPTFVSQPEDVTVPELAPATLTVAYTGYPASCQWYKDLLPLDGATRPTLVISNAMEADADTYFVVVSSPFGDLTSRVATLTVVLDSAGPALWSAVRSADLAGVSVVFSEPLDASSAVAVPNYSILQPSSGSFVVVRSATLSNGNTVLLTTDPLAVGSDYVLTVNHVLDASPHANPIAPDSRIAIGGGRVPVLAIDGIWKYDDSGNDLGTAWRERDFDDNAWLSGVAVLFNDDWSHSPSPLPFPTNTVLAVTNPAGGQIITHYFRHRFNFAACPEGAVLALRHVVDDGAVFYLNGQEIYRVGMPPGPVTGATPASRLVSDARYEGPVLVPVASLVFGENVLAVETHQTPGLLDVSFGAEVEALVSSFASLAPFVVVQPESQNAREGQPAVFSAVVSASAFLQWYKNELPLPLATHATLTLPGASPADDGVGFTLVASNGFGAVTSAVATLTVIAETTRPELVSALLVSNNPAHVLVTFSKPVDQATATNVFNYAVTNATGPDAALVGASLLASTTVDLTLADWRPGIHTVVVSHVKDRAFLGNEIIPNSRVTVGASNVTVLAMGGSEVWRYNQADADLGAAWRQKNYDDQMADWTNGSPVFDWKYPAPRATVAGVPVGTQLNGLGNDGYTVPTMYFRKWLTAPVSGPEATLSLRHLVDDGAAWYLNGQLAFSYQIDLPAYFSEVANTTVETAAIQGPFPFPTTNLVAGTNLLAVEVHNASATSWDITFATELTLNVPSVVLSPGGATAPGAVQVTRQPQSLVAPELQPVTLTVGYQGSVTWIQWYRRGPGGPEVISGATAPALQIPSALGGLDDGVYFVVVGDSSSQDTSADATVAITQAPAVIISQPASQAVPLGQAAVFQVAACGSQLFSYQWRFNQVEIPDATFASFRIPIVGTNHVGVYSVCVSNALGGVLSADASLTLSVVPALDCPELAWTLPDVPWFVQTAVTHDGVQALQSGDTSAGGADSTIQTAVTGPSLLSFWWKKDAGYGISSLKCLVDGTVAASQLGPCDWVRRSILILSGSHTVQWVFNGGQAAWLDQVALTAPTPQILGFPSSAVVFAGTNLTLRAVVDGGQPLDYQWFFDEVEIPGATNATLELPNMQVATAGNYTLRAANQFGLTLSNALLAVADLGLGFMPQRLHVFAFPGTTKAIEANSMGSDPRTYQWRFEGAEIPCATNATLLVPNVSSSQSGRYSVVVKNASGQATGPDIELTVGWMSHVVHISGDGLGAKYLASALAANPASFPSFVKLLTEGAGTLNARCDYDAGYTVPNHLSMITGRPVLRPAGQPVTVPHGFTDDWSDATSNIHTSGNTNVPYKASVFDVAHDHGLRTGFFASKSTLQICAVSYNSTNGGPDLIPPDNGRDKIDYVAYPGWYSSNVVDAFLPSLTNGAPFDYAFLHLEDMDSTGHGSGWGSPEWMVALQGLDTQLGRILSAIETNADPAVALSTAVIVTADHGGVGNSHNASQEYSYTIPLLVWGPSFAPGTDLYTLFANRADPGTNRLDYNAIWQPLRNGDSGNLALALLGLPSIPGSTIIPLFPTSTPSLAAVPEGQGVRLDWSAAAAGFNLEWAESPAPGATWTPVLSGIVTNVSGFTYSVPLDLPARFFRLRK